MPQMQTMYQRAQTNGGYMTGSSNPMRQQMLQRIAAMKGTPPPVPGTAPPPRVPMGTGAPPAPGSGTSPTPVAPAASVQPVVDQMRNAMMARQVAATQASSAAGAPPTPQAPGVPPTPGAPPAGFGQLGSGGPSNSQWGVAPANPMDAGATGPPVGGDQSRNSFQRMSDWDQRNADPGAQPGAKPTTFGLKANRIIGSPSGW